MFANVMIGSQIQLCDEVSRALTDLWGMEAQWGGASHLAVLRSSVPWSPLDVPPSRPSRPEGRVQSLQMPMRFRRLLSRRGPRSRPAPLFRPTGRYRGTWRDGRGF